MTTESTSLLSTAHGGAKRAHSCEDSFSSSSESDGGFAGGEKGAWKGEAKIISKSAAPLTLAFLLQSSLQFTSTICVGHIGTTELGAVALGAMTATITGYSVFIGLATSLDTLCAQAYGSGNHSLLGLHVQRMILLLFTVAIPIACVWLSGTHILLSLLPHEQTEIAHLAGRYLKIVILGLPGYALFESGKRYVQAQGNFKGTMFVLCVVAPINVVLHWLFVWKLEWGFVGCPIAIVIAQSLLPAILLLYVWLCVGPGCWPGYSGKVFTNWGPMVKLAIPGMTMVVAEHLAFEILTVASAQLSQTHLGAQTILMNLVIIAYMLPFPFSIAASTRLAHLIGASEPEAAKVAAKVTYVVGGLIGIFNMLVLSAFRPYIPRAFTTDAAVVALAAQVLPVNAAFQLFDALTAQCNGILRGLGRQKIGGYISILVFYVIAIPVSLGTAFGAGWSLGGLWMGPALALLTQSSSESVYIWFTDWKQACREAADRNMSG